MKFYEPEEIEEIKRAIFILTVLKNLFLFIGSVGLIAALVFLLLSNFKVVPTCMAITLCSFIFSDAIFDSALRHRRLELLFAKDEFF